VTIRIDHDEIMRRAAISPTLSAHARKCDGAQQASIDFDNSAERCARVRLGLS